MADWSSRTVITTVKQYCLPSPTNWAQVRQILAAIDRELSDQRRWARGDIACPRRASVMSHGDDRSRARRRSGALARAINAGAEQMVIVHGDCRQGIPGLAGGAPWTLTPTPRCQSARS
jgi:hypothetical protein